MTDPTLVRALEDRAATLRRHMVRMAAGGQAIHLGGSLSIAELMAALFFHFLEVKGGERPRDHFILSKGHAVHAFHACLAELGEVETREFSTLGGMGTRLAGHPSPKTPLVEVATGSLGHGLSVGIGIAIAEQLDGRSSRTVVLMGDGELQEGSVWEAALCAPRFGLTNLLAIVDRNRLQANAAVDDILPLDPLEEKWRSFRWRTQVIDGHDIGGILAALDRFPDQEGPTLMIADTVKGKGVPALEGRRRAHFTTLADDEVKEALAALEAR
jgi:transketolase